MIASPTASEGPARRSSRKPGSLGLPREEPLRAAVAAWPEIVEDPNGDEWLGTRATFERGAPRPIDEGVMTNALRAAGRMRRVSPVPAPDLSRLPPEPSFPRMIA